MDRDKKSQAMERLLDFYRQKFENATTDDVKKKFNSLRTNFRKELKKIKDSKKSGAGAEEIYQSTLWYFDAMSFLVDQETPSDSISTIDYEHEEFEQEAESISITPTVDAVNTNRKRRCKPRENDPAEEFIKLACTRLQEPQCDESQIATTWTRELKIMAPEQRIFAKKFINDIIFEGQMGTLHRNSVKINEQDRFDTPLSSISNSTLNSNSQLHAMEPVQYSTQNSEQLSNYFSSFQ